MILAFALIGLVLLYQIQNYLFNRLWMKNLTSDITLSADSAMEGEDLTLMESVTNRKWMPLPAVQVKFMTSRSLIFCDGENAKISDHYYRNDMLSLMMFQRITRTLTFRCSHRGYYTIQRIDVICSNLFMTIEHFISFDLNLTLYVYPKLIEQSRIQVPFQKMLGTVLTKRFINEDPFEFCNIREYQSYDSQKAINWKASAKTSSLKVNIHDYTSAQQIKILLNLEIETLRIQEDLIEECIRLAATLALNFIHHGVPVSIITNAKDILTKERSVIPPGSGTHHNRVLMEALSRIDSGLGTIPFLPILHDELHHKSHNDYVILISSYQKESHQQILIDSLKSGKEFCWFLPINQEIRPHVKDQLASRVVPWEAPV